MKEHLSIYALLLLLLFAACSGNNRKLEYVLQFAGNNRGELEKVLAHYKDSGLKYEAARFLIENMPHYYERRGIPVDSGKAALATVDTTGLVLPALVERWGHPDMNILEKVYDAQVITSDFLICNIEHAFDAWKSRPWNKYLPFADFCELILPYRIDDEPLEEWRSIYEKRYAFLLDSVYKGTDVVEAAATVGRCLKEEGFVYNWEFGLPHLGASFLLDHRMGTCVDACDLTLYAMRSLGIPVAVDYYLYSSETRKGHTWNSVRDTTGAFWGMWVTDKEWKRGQVYRDGRKSGKIFRRCFGDPYYADASVDYFPDTLRVKVAAESPEYLFLGIFHPKKKWVIAHVAEVCNGEVVFPHVEPDAIYGLLEKKGDGSFATVDYPFYFDGKSPHFYVPDKEKEESVVLYRKHPLMAWIGTYLDEIHGARFDFSDTEDFKRIKYTYQVSDTPSICYNEVLLPVRLKCRYVRYQAMECKNTNIGELLFGEEGTRLYPVTVEGPPAENPVNVSGRMFDDDPLTYYSTRSPGATLLMDFGTQVEIDCFVFIPRNDDNFIRIGDTYELYYHDGKNDWVSLGRKIATKPELTYDNLPHGALFHLRCLTRGEEEQVFHIKDGKQVFISNLNYVR